MSHVILIQRPVYDEQVDGPLITEDEWRAGVFGVTEAHKMLMDGGVRVTMPGRVMREGETEEQYYAAVAAKALAAAPKRSQILRRVPKAELPMLESKAHWKFRNSWRMNGVALEVNMPLARGQRMAEIRKERDKRLQATDGLWMRATERNQVLERQRLEQIRQTLRDIPQTIDLEKITTPDELAAFEPEWPA